MPVKQPDSPRLVPTGSRRLSAAQWLPFVAGCVLLCGIPGCTAKPAVAAAVAAPSPAAPSPAAPSPAAPVRPVLPPAGLPAPAPPAVPVTPPAASTTPAVPGAPATPPATSAAGTLEITRTPAGVSVYAVLVDAQKLFTSLAEQSEMQIIVDDTVKRQITVNLVNLKPEDALKAIVSASGLSSSLIKGIWMISEGIPSGPSSYLLSEIDSIPAQYVDAASAKSLLPVFLQDYVKVDDAQNSVVLSAPAPVLEKFRGDIKQFDVPATQILFDVLMVELTTDHADQLNLGLAGPDPTKPQPNLVYSNAGKGLSLVAGLGQLLYQGVSTLPNSFQVQLQALLRNGEAHIRANPQIATVSGKAATVFIGLQRYISTPVELPESGGSNYGQTLNFISAGVNLKITPLTGATGIIFTTLDTEVSVLGADDPTTHLPDKSTRHADTVVTVRDGQTIILGGLNQDEIHETRTKVPLLGDIPVLGALFRTHSLQHTHTQLLILITPHVLSETGHLPAVEEQRLKDQFLGPTSGISTPRASDNSMPSPGPAVSPAGLQQAPSSTPGDRP